MKLLFTLPLLFAFFVSFSQQEKFQIEGRIINKNGNPVADAYLVTFSNQDKNISNFNGIFSIWVHPSDSIIISHISYLRKIITVHQILVNPIIELQLDSINISEVNVSPDQKTDSEKAMENIKSIEFDFRPQPDDNFTETERMKTLFNTENQVERAYSNSLNFLQFSPSEQIGKLKEKRKKKREAKQFSSTKEIEQKKEK